MFTIEDLENLYKARAETLKLCPSNICGFISKQKDSDKFYLNRDKELGEHIIIDGILSKVITRKNNIIKTEDGYIIEENGIFSHGKSIKEARDSLIYKIGDRDTSEYNEATLNTVLNFKDAVKMYRVITGACEQGTKIFVKNLENVKEEYSIKEIIEITTGHFGNEKLINFFKVK